MSIRYTSSDSPVRPIGRMIEGCSIQPVKRVFERFQIDSAGCIDSMVIPADSPNPAAALAFINFAMRPAVSASVTRYIGFATANAAALPLLEPAVRDNTIIYPPPKVRERFALQKVYTPDEARTFSRAWLQFKSSL
jgi:spermidine/putrescine-binding protein